jgi:general secretion pathway protein G
MFRYCTGQFPKKLDELVRKPADPAIAAKWKGPYLRYSDDLLDPWKRPLGYRPPSMNAPTQVFLWSVGPDGVAGTPDDIRNW